MTIAENLRMVRDRIARGAEASARDPKDVKLICVSKTKPALAVREAYEAGARAFGENYAQELVEKAEALSDLKDIEWHFIGHLQTNKAKLVAKVAHVVHTIDKNDLVREIDKRLTAENRAIRALVEVNVSGEAQKHGAAASDVPALCDAVIASTRLSLVGLMTMPPADDLEEARRVFTQLAKIRETLRASLGASRAASVNELSMGMSADLEIAIACGATFVRVGSAIFGERAHA